MYKYMNMFTGAVYHTFKEAFLDAIWDIIKCPNCRSIKMFNIRKIEEV